MIKTYIKIALRDLWRNRLFSMINIGGLTFSMAVGLIFILGIKTQFEFDGHQPYPDRTYRIMTDKLFEQGTDTYATTPAILAQKIKGYAAVEKVVQLSQGENVVASNGKKELDLDLKYASSDFLSMFDFELINENSRALDEPNTLLISEKKATDFWGKTDPVGQILNVPGKGNFKIAGVIKTNKNPTHFNFDALASSAVSKNAVLTETENWANTEAGYTYVLLTKNAGKTDLKKHWLKLPVRQARI